MLSGVVLKLLFGYAVVIEAEAFQVFPFVSKLRELFPRLDMIDLSCRCVTPLLLTEPAERV